MASSLTPGTPEMSSCVSRSASLTSPDRPDPAESPDSPAFDAESSSSALPQAASASNMTASTAAKYRTRCISPRISAPLTFSVPVSNTYVKSSGDTCYRARMSGDALPDGEPGSVQRRAPFSVNPEVGVRGQRAQQRILEAALQVFGEVGYHRCGVARITEVAGCSRAAFYQYFSS